MSRLAWCGASLVRDDLARRSPRAPLDYGAGQ
jgi:hypothetical protein